MGDETRHKPNIILILTDDQGWRLEIRRYPALTTVGAWRREADGSRYGGFYTQEQVREIGFLASRVSIGSILILFVIGLVLLYFVDEEKGRREVGILAQVSSE